MSIDALRICCTGCDFEAAEVFEPLRIVYRSDDGKGIESDYQKGWCYRCDTYTHIEHLNAEELREELILKRRERSEFDARLAAISILFLARFRNRSTRSYIEGECQRLDASISDLVGLIQIATTRKSRPRCLECWSADTFPLSFNRETRVAANFKHKCGGLLKSVEHETTLRLSFTGIRILALTTEGELLEQLHEDFWT